VTDKRGILFVPYHDTLDLLGIEAVAGLSKAGELA